jgi:CRISPR-associated endonuclease/helicase Cas3
MTLPPLDASEFRDVFAAVHGVPPFPWQNRLVDRLASGKGWPEALDLPTSSGKTAAIDAALFHLALQAGDGARRQAPVRICFVVDRRIIVDAAAARALLAELSQLQPARPEAGTALRQLTEKLN